MKKRKKTKKNESASKVQRLPALIVLALVVLAIGGISAVSKQLIGRSQTGNNTTAKESNAKKFMTVKVAGQDVQVDSETGKLKPLSPEQAERLALGLKKMVNKSADGLTEVQHEDGSVSMDLEGRFRHVVIAREREDGSLSMSCVDNPRAAAAALGVDPKLLADGNSSDPLPTARQKN